MGKIKNWFRKNVVMKKYNVTLCYGDGRTELREIEAESESVALLIAEQMCRERDAEKAKVV